jgi:hypothetical protein
MLGSGSRLIDTTSKEGGLWAVSTTVEMTARAAEIECRAMVTGLRDDGPRSPLCAQGRLKAAPTYSGRLKAAPTYYRVVQGVGFQPD